MSHFVSNIHFNEQMDCAQFGPSNNHLYRSEQIPENDLNRNLNSNLVLSIHMIRIAEGLKCSGELHSNALMVSRRQCNPWVYSLWLTSQSTCKWNTYLYSYGVKRVRRGHREDISRKDCNWSVLNWFTCRVLTVYRQYCLKLYVFWLLQSEALFRVDSSKVTQNKPDRRQKNNRFEVESHWLLCLIGEYKTHYC